MTFNLFYATIVFSTIVNGLPDIHGLKYYESVDYDLNQYEQFLIRNSNSLQLNLSVFNRTFRMDLKLANFDIEISENGKFSSIDRSFFLEGTVEDKDSFVSGYIEPGGLFRGKIRTPVLHLDIIPAYNFKELKNLPQIHTIAFRHFSEHGTDLINRPLKVCGHNHSIKNSVMTDSNIRIKKRQSSASVPMICDCRVYVDYVFFKRVQDMRGNTAQGLTYLANEVKLLFSETSKIFQSTTFEDEPNSKTYSDIRVRPISLSVDSENTWMVSKLVDTSVNKHLEYFSDEFNADHGTECSRVLISGISHDAVVGLAYLGMIGTSAGIFKLKNSLLMSVHSSTNTFVSLQDSAVLLAHEIGHLFSSQHDMGGTCLPGSSSSGGDYIMSAFASTISKPNNNKFSSCTIKVVGPLITARSALFKHSITPVCGDGILEKTEECEPQSSTDECCDSKCKFKNPTFTCSASHGPCCSKCTTTPATDHIECRKISLCTLATFCDGKSYNCPAVKTTNEGKLCKLKIEGEISHFVCNKGVCNGSVCTLDFGWNQCLPKTNDASTNCLLSCQKNNNGSSCILSSDTSNLPANVTKFFSDFGLKSLPTSINSNCYQNSKQKNSDESYCDAKHICRVRTSDTSIQSIISKLLNSNIILFIKNRIKANMWIIAVVVVLFLVLSFVLVLVCSPPIKGDNPYVARNFSVHRSKYDKARQIQGVDLT